MKENIKRINSSVWITDGEKNVMITRDTVDQYLLDNPKWRKGRSNAFTYIDRTHKKNRMKKMEKKLYLITGTVRMDPKVPGRSHAQAEQQRLVWANDVNDAMRKYTDHFRNLTNDAENYSVIGMVGSEAIQ